MKRFLVGALVLSGTVGLGSVGAFYGHQLLQQPSTAQAGSAATPGEPVAERDLTPTPIRLSNPGGDPSVGNSNPFGGDAAPADASASGDRYTEASDPVAQGTESGQEADPETTAITDKFEGDIPPANTVNDAEADSPAARLADPPTQDRDPRGRYAERAAAAELVEPANATTSETPGAERSPRATPSTLEPADEPRALEPAPTGAALDRYGRTTPGSRSGSGQPDPAVPAAPAAPHDATTDVAPHNPSGEEPQAAGPEGTGRPGDPRLSGAQAPTLTIEKTAPPEIQIGKPAKFLIKVHNVGSVAAHGVEVHDVVPQGTQLVSTHPDATRGASGELVWDLGTLQPGHEQSLELELMPTAEGEIGSVATVQFRAQASVRTMATKPMLVLEANAPERVMKDQELTLRIKISNPGSGAATGVVLSENVPQGLTHPSGHELEFDVGTLKPGESRELALGLVASGAGKVTNILRARGEGSLEAETQTEVEVIAPQLAVSMTGPKRRYLERNATHNISISNPGTAPAKNIELVAVLPRELKFVQANNGGQFDPASHSVYWALEELPPQETGTVTLTTLPLAAGEARLLIRSRAQQNLADQREEVLAIEGLAAINFQLSDVSDPIEVNGQTTYEVRVTNQGSKAATNVRLAALLPAQMKPISAEGPVRYRIDGQNIVFEPLKQLAPKADTSFSITAQALEPGDLRLQVQIATDEIPEPVTKEESTRVYGDE